MTKYTTTKNSVDELVIIRENENGSVTSFLADESNSDYQAYLESLKDAAN